MYKKKNRGITIVSLVITIILLLILAGISIQALTNTGLFEQALTAKEKAKISDYEEALSLSKTEAVFENNYPGAEQKSILERMKNILSGQELFTGSDYEIVDNTLTITTSDGYVFEVTVDDAGDAKINYISKSDKIPPIINITATSGTTNTITVTVTARKNEGGRIEFYIAKSGENYSNKADGKIEKIENNKEYTYTFENLEQEKTYKIKVVAIATNKQEATAEIERTTGNIPELMAEDIKFAYDPKVWTNGDVKVTAKIVNKEIDTKRFTLRLTRDIATDATEWATATEGLKVSTNGEVYAVLVDNKGQIGESTATGNVQYIDTKIPVASITSKTTNSITFTGTDTADTAKGEQASKVAGYMLKTNNTKPSATDSGWQAYDGTSKTVSGLTQGNTYYLFVKDNAGNVSNAVSNTTDTVTGLTQANVTFTYSPSGWTNGSVKVTATLKNMTSSYTLKITDSAPTNASKQTALGWANASTGITVTTNKMVYAVLVDNEGQIGDATTGNVQYIDTKIPVASITNKTTNSITFTGTDTADTAKGEQASKVAGYMLKTNNTKPSATDSGWQAYNGTSKKVSGLKQGNTYYLFVKDNAGNVSNAVSNTTDTVTGLTQANVTFTYSPSGWTNGSVKVTATLKNMTSLYTLKITDSDPTNASKQTALGWANASTGITVTTNKMVYAVLVDNEGQIGDATTGNVQYIDTKIPVASITSKTTNSITFTGTDTADTTKGEQASKVAGYMLKTNNTKPSATDSGWQAYDGTSKKVSGLKQGNTYYLFVKDNAGNVSNAVSNTTDTVTGLTQANVTFTYSPSGWTNGSVKVTATLKNMTSSYTLKITDSDPTNASKQTALGWANASTGITVTTNKMVYAVLVDNEGQIGDATTGNVQYIDTKIPVASITSKTTNSITFTGTDTADTTKGEQASKVAGYMIKTNNTKPSATDSGWQTYNGTSKKVSGLKQGNTYYLFVKDNAGNVSNAVSNTTDTVTGLTQANVTFTYSPSGWTNGSVKVTATLKNMTSSYTLKITDSAPTNASKQTALGWANASTGITVTTNKMVYAVLVDNEGQIGDATTGNVQYIDTKIPVASITSKTTNSITFTGTDTADTAKGEQASKVAGYMLKTNNTKPSATDSGWQTYNGTSKTVSGLTQGNTYYLFVKDNAGNVSNAVSDTTGSVTISKGNIISSVTGWNGTTATVKFTTSTGYYIQTSTDGENWTRNPSTTGEATTTATTGTTVYARLTDSSGQYNSGDVASITPVLTYTISFNGNGATSGTMSSLTSRAYGTSYRLTSNAYSIPGYNFKGWNTKADGSGTSYANGASVKNLTTTNGATVTLYAQWELAEVWANEVSFKPSDSSWDATNVQEALDDLLK